MNKKQKKILIRILIAAGVLAVLFIGEHFLNSIPAWAFAIAYLIPYLVIGYDILKKAFKGIKNRQVLDENFLMAIATVGAYALGEYIEAVAVMLFYQIGELFQSVAVGKSRRNIANLMDIRPDYADLLEEEGDFVNEDSPRRVSPEEVPVGSLILVKPGEKVPLDGIIEKGESTLNTAALTGESVPRDVARGDAILSGCINLSGVLVIRTTKDAGESTVSKILELVENASSRKSKSEDFISRFARVYTPIVCIGALLLAFFPPMLSLLLARPLHIGTWVYRALTFLVISCPCALVISIPLGFFGGIGGASHAGILVKGSNYLESLSKTKVVVFDKTGTLTKGSFGVEKIYVNQGDEDEVLSLAAAAERFSSHPIAKSLVEEAKIRGLALPDVTDISEISGKGITGKLGGEEIFVGNAKLLQHFGLDGAESVPENEIGTKVFVAKRSGVLGCILIRDRVKEGAAEAIRSLKKSGIVKTVVLTGDAEDVARDVANRLGIEEVHANLLPEEKVKILEKIMEKNPGVVSFVGDGINDAPVLTRADIGIAMGAMGSDAAIEAADVVLMDDDPIKIAKGIRISKKCLRIVYENIWFAIGVKVICLILAAFGIANMWLAIFADVGVMVLAVLNAIRALRV